ncbi:MAG: carboxypeptidase-like regulatory domain-containing protein [Acidobacteria bacterium]|nr:carboxypeptidase-like regulatory domain-containing protein [Acidobacteriota bacterium]
MEAQIGGGSIVGTVKDPAGAAVVGATVQAVNVETDEVSCYEFPLLPNSDTTNLNFGQILGASGGRNIQLALKYLF